VAELLNPSAPHPQPDGKPENPTALSAIFYAAILEQEVPGGRRIPRPVPVRFCSW